MRTDLSVLEKRRLKFVAELIMGQSASPESMNYEGDGVPFLQGCSEFGSVHPTPEKFSTSPPKVCSAGDWLMSVRAPVGKINLANAGYGIGRGLCAVRAFNGMSDPRFLGYALVAAVPELQSNATGSTYDAVAISDVADMVIGLPPLPEQRAIADFLDRETAKIDDLIAKQKELISISSEAHSALECRSITHGLDGYSNLKSTGITWWDKIPVHWELKPLKYLVRPDRYITYGIVQAGPHIEDGVPYIRTTDLSGSELPLSGYLKTSKEIDESYARSRVLAGEIVIAIRSTVGRSLKVPFELNGANLTQGTARISPNKELDADYLLLVLNSAAALSGFTSMAKGATFKEITLEMLRNFIIPVPPKSEQLAIVAHIEKKRSVLLQLSKLAGEQQNRLIERRSALITAAVTGQIEIPSYIANEAAA